MIYTTIGHWEDMPETPLCHEVEASSIADAIAKSKIQAHEDLLPSKTFRRFINTFVIEGEVNIVSTWAG